MTNVQKNFISFLLGCMFSYLTLWFSGIGAAAPVPEFLRESKEYFISFYSSMVIVLTTAVFSYLILLITRKLFSQFTKQNLLCFAIPIVLFVTSMLIAMGFVVAPLLYAAISTLCIAALLTRQKKHLSL